MPSRDENVNKYKYILSCLDDFSRYLKTIEVANQLKEIFMTFGSREIFQCDKGSEFQGILPLIFCLHLLRGQLLCTYIVKLFCV